MNDKRDSVWVPIVLTVVIIGAISLGAGFLATSYDLPRYLFNKVLGAGENAPEVEPKNRPIFRGPDATIEPSRMTALRELMEAEQFDTLNVTLVEYQEAFEEDPGRDIALYDAYQSFYVTLPHYEVLLEKWIDTHPEDYQPYLAAGHYYYARGWQSRGFKWRRDTSEEQINGMVSNFATAKDRLNTALEINPNLMLAYNILIGVHNAGGSDHEEDQTTETALSRFPASFIIRSTAAWANQPRWGGSYREMWRIANQAEAYAGDHPILTSLYGAIFYDQGRVFESKQEYGKALEMYTKAMTYGDRDQFYRERAELYAFKLKDPDRAYEDIEYAISLRPTRSKNYLARVKIHFSQKDYSAALDDLTILDELFPEDPATMRWCDWASRKLNGRGHKRGQKADLNEALKFYELALSFNEDNHESHFWHGVTNLKLEHYEDAVTDFQKCIDIDPHYFEAYRALDYILAKDRQWDAILSYWDAFIQLEPDHAEAYLERSGTHYHNKNLEQAMADLQKACELGNQKACQQYAKRQGK